MEYIIKIKYDVYEGVGVYIHAGTLTLKVNAKDVETATLKLSHALQRVINEDTGVFYDRYPR